MIDCSAIAGYNYVVMAGDTRLTDGSDAIESRFVPTVRKLDDRVLVSGGGCQADSITFTRRLAQQMEVPRLFHPRPPILKIPWRLTRVIGIQNGPQSAHLSAFPCQIGPQDALWKAILPLLHEYDDRGIGSRWRRCALLL
jgi:Proteasome subunit